MSTKHTPGPWVINDRGKLLKIESESGSTVATIFEHANHLDKVQYRVQAEANAELVAKAPELAALVTELAEALSNLVNAVPNDGTWNYPAAMDAALRTLSKANPH